MIWCTLLDPSIDIICKLDGLELGKKYVDTECVHSSAGKGLTVARVVRALGEEVGVTGVLPEYERKRFETILKESGIVHRFNIIPGSMMRFDITVADKSRSEITRISTTSPPLGEGMANDYIKFASHQMKHGDFWCFSGGVYKGFSDDTFSELIKHGNAAGCKTVLDSRSGLFKRGVYSRPMIIKPNLNELEEFFGEQIKGIHQIALKGKKFLDIGISYVFISLGADGMIALHGNDCLLCSVPAVADSPLTSGNGDSLVAGVLVAFNRKFSFPETCRMAVACGTAKAIYKGAGTIDAASVWQLMEEVKITSV